MRLSEEKVRSWVKQISDDYMHYTQEDFEYVVRYACLLDGEVLPDDAGIIAYSIVKDFDCKKKLSVVLLYCKPEYRGKYIAYMFRRIEEIAKQEQVTHIIIGASDSGYKEEKFNKVVQHFGYNQSVGYIKRI